MEILAIQVIALFWLFLAIIDHKDQGRWLSSLRTFFSPKRKHHFGSK
ncbi:hypothetical protein PN467_09405 [Microcystis aeruginosa CS-563/04]|jgi:hypothetical protein|nr:hypothetical protein [Microcystis aeruginosa]MDB9420737.1 hypothetical protein [Microcystis aeruginosa CS-563/04]